MAGNEKLTILYLMDLLLEQTDREHTMTSDMICAVLERDYGVICSRKTVYRDIATLREYGLKIEQLRGSTPGYYVDARAFELAGDRHLLFGTFHRFLTPDSCLPPFLSSPIHSL